MVGRLRFYPVEVARLFVPPQDDRSPRMLTWACGPGEDEGTLRVQCFMTARPYIGPERDEVTGHNWPTIVKAGARRGIGLKSVLGLMGWARAHDWQRIVKVAHADVDCLYGQLGSGGRAFWEKAGFHADRSYCDRPAHWEPAFVAFAESQGRTRGMAPQEVWTWYRMVRAV